MPKPRCPVCRNRDGPEADGTVVREYRPDMVNGRVDGKLKPLQRDVLKCKWCGTPLLMWHNGAWASAHRVK